MLPHASLPPPAASSPAAEEDRVLLRALRERDESAFAHVLDAYFSSMLHIALGHVRDRATAEEVVQDTWLAALEGIDQFEGRSTAKTWLFHILRNIARGRGRRDDRTRSFSSLQTGDAADGAPGEPDRVAGRRVGTGEPGRDVLWAGRNPDPEELLLSRELESRIEAALAVLPRRQRDVIVLRDIEGWTAAEVCNILDVSDTNQRVLLHRARERVKHELRGYLADNDICHDEHGDHVP
jgi:RNA polymerase sigma-70 factor, ECF subfamily